MSAGRFLGVATLVVAASLSQARVVLAQEGVETERLRDRVRALEERQRELERRLGGAREDPRPPASDPLTEAEPEARPVEPAPARVRVDPKAESGTIKLELPYVKKLTIGGKLRLRGEVRDPKDYRLPGAFGRGATERRHEGTTYVLLRTRLSFDFEISDPLRVMVELSDSRLFGDEDANAVLDPDLGTVNLYQGFLELRLESMTGLPLKLRAGRFEVTPLGDQRLVSPLDWSNVGRSWDGVQATWESSKVWATAFATTIREGAVFATLADGNRDFYFTGFHGSFRGLEKHELDGYVYFRHLGDRRVFRGELGRAGKREDVTVGARVKGAAGSFDYTGEAAFQFGHQARDDVRAFMGAATAGYTQPLDGPDMKVRVGGEYAFASGDARPGDGRNGTFDPLLPFGHYYHGHMDLMGFMNLHAASAQLMFQPVKDLSLHADGHSFWLDKTADAWYGAGKNRIRRDTSGRQHSHVGFELDAYVKARTLDRLWIWAGYSRFFPGTYVRNTGFDSAQDWAFLQVEAKF